MHSQPDPRGAGTALANLTGGQGRHCLPTDLWCPEAQWESKRNQLLHPAHPQGYGLQIYRTHRAQLSAMGGCHQPLHTLCTCSWNHTNTQLRSSDSLRFPWQEMEPGLLASHALDLTLRLRLVTIQGADGTKEYMCPPANAPPVLPGLYVLHTKTLGPGALQGLPRASDSHGILPRAPGMHQDPIQPPKNGKTLVLGPGRGQGLEPFAPLIDCLEENPAGFVSSQATAIPDVERIRQRRRRRE